MKADCQTRWSRRVLSHVLIGNLSIAVCAVAVLMMASEDLSGRFSISFLAVSSLAGGTCGLLVGLYRYCDQQEHLAGVAAAIYYSFIPIVLFGLYFCGASEQSHDEGSFLPFAVVVGTVLWWGTLPLTGIAEARGHQYASTLRATFITVPVVALLVSMHIAFARQAPAPESFWSHWPGTFFACKLVLIPLCCVGLFLGFACHTHEMSIITGAFCVLFIAGAFTGEASLAGLFGPVIAALTGATFLVGGTFWRINLSFRKPDATAV